VVRSGEGVKKKEWGKGWKGVREEG